MHRKIRAYRRIVLVLLLLLTAPSVSSAFDVTGQSRTYLQSRERLDSERLLPLFEYLAFEAGSPGGREITFHFGGWYRYDLEEDSFGDSGDTGYLQYAYLGYRHDKSNAFLNLGRVIVNQGVAFEQVDGASAGADLKAGFGLSAFGGVPVDTDFDTRTGDSVYGGRLSQGREGLYRVGVSYLLEKNDSEEFRKEEGLDLWFRPVDRAEIMGSMLYNAITSARARTSLYLTLGPFRGLTLSTRYMDVSYRDYFTAATTSAFEFQPGGPLDPDEQLALIGQEASLSFGKASVTADFNKYEYDIAGSADYYGAAAAYSGTGAGGGAAYHRMDGETKDRQYSEYRLYAFRKFGRTDLTADALMVDYDAAINGEEKAYSLVLAAAYALSPKTMVGADVEYAKNPFYDKDVRGLLKLVHSFDFMLSGMGEKRNADTGKSKKGRK